MLDLEKDEEIKRLKEQNEELKEEITRLKEKNEKYVALIYESLFDSYIYKLGNLDLMFFSGNFLQYDRYDTKVMEYKIFIINFLDRCDLELLDNIFKDIQKYNKLKFFEEFFKYYQKELERRLKNNEFKKTKYLSLEFQLHKINAFIQNHYNL